MTITTKTYTHEELAARRRDLLASLGLSEDELRERGANYLLNPEERQVLRELERVDYLLGR